MKKLSLVVIWHMHQPNYKSSSTGYYLMPWTRLHAIKDYLDMLLILDKFPNMKQTFSLVPLLLDQLEDYAYNNAHDLHSFLTEKDIKDLTFDDKSFILNSFFDANYQKMILPYPAYDRLYKKRFFEEGFDVDNFSDQEYSDIMAWFNLVWFDPYWKETIPELKTLWEKCEGYTLEDRRRLIQIQRDIISQIIPAYRERFLSGKIEIITSPYYHPILPLLINSDVAKEADENIDLPDNKIDFVEDADIQIKRSITKIKKLFGKRPKGIWPPEQCVSNETFELFEKNGFKWTVTDDGILSKSTGKEVLRDFSGILLDPYELCNAYTFRGKGEKNLKIFFRNSLPSNLFSFQYGNFDPIIAANDVYERLKIMQEKLASSPEEHHVLTIAMDGENCWENYDEDGRPFLLELYRLISEDDTVECITGSEYIKKIEKHKVLNDIKPGSWINRNFNLWIGDPIKNRAYDYLYGTRKDLIEALESGNYSKEVLDAAWNEIYMVQSSDWFWWYGEPNDSGQDDLFDFLFREHLQNVYKILQIPVPDYLKTPLEMYMTRHSGSMCPFIKGRISGTQWQNTQLIESLEGPVYNHNKFIEKVFFGCDSKNLYLKFEFNTLNIMADSDISKQVVVYFQLLNVTSDSSFSPIRFRSRSNVIPALLKQSYSYELAMMFRNNRMLPILLSQSIENSLWYTNFNYNVKYDFVGDLEIAIPFDDIKVRPKAAVNIVVVTGIENTIEEVISVDKPIIMVRPE